MTIRPFLSTLGPAAVTPLALPALDVPSKPSPWSPKQESPGTVGGESPMSIDVEAVRAEARERGHAEGMRETAALRDRLIAMTEELAAARAALVGPAAETIADIASTVIAAWIDATDNQAVFAPIVRDWIAKTQEPAVAHANPADAGELRAAIGDAAITVEANPAVAPGELRIASASFEITHAWNDRLRELREAIVAMLKVEP